MRYFLECQKIGDYDENFSMFIINPQVGFIGQINDKEVVGIVPKTMLIPEDQICKANCPEKADASVASPSETQK